jgi:hypothetical protein
MPKCVMGRSGWSDVPEFASLWFQPFPAPAQIAAVSGEIGKLRAGRTQGRRCRCLYFNGRGRAKVELALAKGRQAQDKLNM